MQSRAWKFAAPFFVFVLAFAGSLACASRAALAADRASRYGQPDPIFEISALGALSKTDYGNGTYSTSRHYTGMAGWNLLPVTELELSYSYGNNFFNADPAQTTSETEETLGLTIVQDLVPPHSFIDLYLRGGVGQYNRTETGTVNGIATPTQTTKSPAGILGGGIKIRLFGGFALKVDGTAYLPNFNISGAVNNFVVQGGFSLTFY